MSTPGDFGTSDCGWKPTTNHPHFGVAGAGWFALAMSRPGMLTGDDGSFIAKITSLICCKVPERSGLPKISMTIIDNPWKLSQSSIFLNCLSGYPPEWWKTHPFEHGGSVRFAGSNCACLAQLAAYLVVKSVAEAIDESSNLQPSSH